VRACRNIHGYTFPDLSRWHFGICASRKSVYFFSPERGRNSWLRGIPTARSSDSVKRESLEIFFDLFHSIYRQFYSFAGKPIGFSHIRLFEIENNSK